MGITGGSMNKEHLLRIAKNMFVEINKHEPCSSQQQKMQQAIDNGNVRLIKRLYLINNSWLKSKDIKIPDEYLTLNVNRYDFDDPRIAELSDWQYVEEPSLDNPFGNSFCEDDLTDKIDELEAEKDDAIAELIEWLDEQETEPDPAGLELEVLENIAEKVAMLEELYKIQEELPNHFGCYEEGYLDEDWAEESTSDCYYDVFKDMPSWIKDAIDWSIILDSLIEDYSEIEIFGESYMYEER